ncbi:MAG: hypothetical protein HKN33_04275 [Pyrinomonadaceae bacterium]|nr:hypothetical protein [Pyrinomonadaceae bacterium]
MRNYSKHIIGTLLLLIAVTSASFGASTEEADDCSIPELKAFDFLLGEWEIEDGSGTMSITKILDGCGIRETWKLDGFNAVLVRTYDSRTKKWFLSFAAHDLVPQVWDGRLEAGTWIFYRDWELDGKKRRSRTFWKPTQSGGFEKIVEQLNDDGKSWRLHARSVFKRLKKKSKSKH